MIRRAAQLEHFEKTMFGGPGVVRFNKLVSEESLHGKGRLYNRVLLRPGAAVGRHRHNGDQEIFYILRGEGLYNDNGREVMVTAGDVTVCNDGEEHALLNTGAEDLEMIALILYTGK